VTGIGSTACPHPVLAEHSEEMVHLVGDEPGQSALEDRDVGVAVHVLVLDLDSQGRSSRFQRLVVTCGERTSTACG